MVRGEREWLLVYDVEGCEAAKTTTRASRHITPHNTQTNAHVYPKQCDSDSEDEELSNQNDMLVVKIEYNGIVYFLNESTNDIYDPISGDIVGVYDTGIINLY